MTSHSNTVAEFPHDPRGFAAAHYAETRPFHWSVRREIWENRAVYIAPLIVAAIVLFATMINTTGMPKRLRAAGGDPAKQRTAMVRPLQMAPAPIMLASFMVGMFYCLDALYGERRDRSILFWKSLPVSDRTTVLSKAAIPLIVLPSLALLLSIVVQIVLLHTGTAVMVGKGLSPARLWAEMRFFEGTLIMFYGLFVHTLWFAPIYGWLLLVSAWARRTPFLWAVLPMLAISAVERIVFGSMHFMHMLQYRVTGAMAEAFVMTAKGDHDIEGLAQLTPVKFLSAPGLWAGLIFTVLCLAAAVRLRRNREPI